MEEGSFMLSSVLRKEVRDAEGREVGHLEDLAFDLSSRPPVATHLAVHLEWTDRIGELLLPRPVEDIVLLLPWSELESMEEEALHLKHAHPNFEVVSCEGKTLARRDMLNKQIVDEEGNRLQRVDEVIIKREGILIFLEGLQVGMEWFPAGKRVQKLVSRLRKRYRRTGEVNVIPYEAILRVDEDAIVIGVRS
jgi:sporulation protein YlmC with PRC-barrel domain